MRHSFKRHMIATILAAGTLMSTLSWLPAQPTTAAGAKPAGAKATKPKSRTESRAAIATVNANALQVTTKEGNLDVGLTAQTEFWRMEDNLKPAEVKVGDSVAFPLRSTEGQATVTSTAPLTLKFGNEATLTFSNTEKLTLDRMTLIKSSDLAAGQNVAIAMNVLPDGKLEARKVTVVVAKQKAAAAPKPKK